MLPVIGDVLLFGGSRYIYYANLSLWIFTWQIVNFFFSLKMTAAVVMISCILIPREVISLLVSRKIGTISLETKFQSVVVDFLYIENRYSALAQTFYPKTRNNVPKQTSTRIRQPLHTPQIKRIVIRKNIMLRTFIYICTTPKILLNLKACCTKTYNILTHITARATSGIISKTLPPCSCREKRLLPLQQQQQLGFYRSRTTSPSSRTLPLFVPSPR